MYAVIFKAVIRQRDTGYVETAGRLRQLAKTRYGCLDVVSYTEGER